MRVGGCLAGPSPCHCGSFEGCSNELPPAPMGAAPMRAWQLPGAVLHLGVGSALIPPSLSPPPPPNGPQEVTGTPGQALLK